MSAICQAALERAVRDVTSARGSDEAPDESRAWSGLFGRFTPRARRAVTLAEEAARAIPHNYVGTEHVLLGVIDEGSNLALKVLQSLDIEIDDLRVSSRHPWGRRRSDRKDTSPSPPRAKHVLELTAKESMALGHNYIGCEHVLLGLIAEEQGMAGKVLRRMGVELRTTRRAVVTALSGFVHATAEHLDAEPVGRRPRRDPSAPRGHRTAPRKLTSAAALSLARARGARPR